MLDFTERKSLVEFTLQLNVSLYLYFLKNNVINSDKVQSRN